MLVGKTVILNELSIIKKIEVRGGRRRRNMREKKE